MGIFDRLMGKTQKTAEQPAQTENNAGTLEQLPTDRIAKLLESGVLHASEIFEKDGERYVEIVYGTASTKSGAYDSKIVKPIGDQTMIGGTIRRVSEMPKDTAQRLLSSNGMPTGNPNLYAKMDLKNARPTSILWDGFRRIAVLKDGSRVELDGVEGSARIPADMGEKAKQKKEEDWI